MPRRDPLRRVLGGLGVGLVAVILSALLSPGSVQAHAFLVNSSPQAGERLPASPHALRLRFTEQVAFLRSDHVTLESAADRPAPIGSLHLSAGGTELVTALPHLSSGIYIVNWSVVSSDDGHPSAGQFAFAVGSGGRLPALAASSSAPTDWWDAMAEWLLLLGLAVSAGGLAGALLVWGPISRGQSWKAPSMPVRVPLVIALVAAAVLFVRYIATLHNAGAGAELNGNVVMQAVDTRAGGLSLAVCGLLLYALLVSFLPMWRYAALCALILAAIATALRSHPAATTCWWCAPAIAIHLVLAILWSGALIQLVIVFWRHGTTLPREAMLVGVRRYAGLALWSVIVVLVSGFAAALSEFSSVGQLATRGYGLVILGKGVLVVVALLLAFLARTDALGRPVGGAIDMLRTLTRAEAAVLVAVLAASALLSNLAPPFVAPLVRASAANSLLGPPPPAGPALTLAGKAGWLEVYFTASRDQITIRIVSPNDEAPRNVDFHLEAQRPHRTETVSLFPRSCGSGCFSMHFRWLRGTTRLRLRVTTREWSGGRLSFAMPWPLLPPDGRLFRNVIARMQAKPSLLLTERTSSTPNTSFAHTYRTSGRQFIASEPYSARVAGIRPLPSAGGLRQLVLYLSGSDIWVHLWIDAHYRIRREVIVDPGHLIERTFSYTGR